MIVLIVLLADEGEKGCEKGEKPEVWVVVAVVVVVVVVEARRGGDAFGD